MKQGITYVICRYYPNGRVTPCAEFSTPERAQAIAQEWHRMNPSAYFQVHESTSI